jgi:hypothetical protein
LYLASKDLFCYSAAVTAEVEEEEFVCTSPGRPSPNSLPDSPYVFYFFCKKLKMDLQIGLKKYLLSGG